MLIPLLGDSFETNIAPWIAHQWSFLMAVLLMVAGVMVLFWLERSIGKMLKAVGWMMFIPGLLAIIFSFVTSDGFFSWMRSSISGFAIVEPGVEWLVHHAVPHTANIGAIYIVIGIGLVWLGKRMSHLAQYL